MTENFSVMAAATPNSISQLFNTVDQLRRYLYITTGESFRYALEVKKTINSGFLHEEDKIKNLAELIFSMLNVLVVRLGMVTSSSQVATEVIKTFFLNRSNGKEFGLSGYELLAQTMADMTPISSGDPVSDIDPNPLRHLTEHNTISPLNRLLNSRC